MTTCAQVWSGLDKFYSKWEMFQTKFVEKIKTHIMFNNLFFFENRAVYEIMWKSMVEPDKPEITI
jgi:hypothetical protein